MKLLFLSNFAMGLYQFRKELIEQLIAEGHEVYTALPTEEYSQKLVALGCHNYSIKIDRRGTNPFKDLRMMLSYLKLISKIKPDVVLTYTVKPNIYGGIACRICKTPYLSNITGLGTSMENKGILRSFILGLYKIGLKKSSCVFFQNESNRRFFLKNHLIKGKNKLLPGSGVNLKQHNYEEYPPEEANIRLLYIGRMMRDKGMNELLFAAKQVKDIYPKVQFDLVGFCEESFQERLKYQQEEGIIHYYGQQEDVHSFIRNSHALILPSYHEGMANVLLEAAATGRPILASRIAGCREAFQEDVSGYSFEIKNLDSLTSAIIKFIETPYAKKQAMGLAGRRKMELEFDRQIVINAYIAEIYDSYHKQP